MMLGPMERRCVAIATIFLVTLALIAWMAGCQGYSFPPPSEDLEIRTWYDLDDVRNNVQGHHLLMNDLNSTTQGYQELAGPTANGGKGWEPIGAYAFDGSFNGQGHEIRDLFIDRPNETQVGLFGYVFTHGVIENLRLVNANVTGSLDTIYHGSDCAGSLVGYSFGTVNNCSSTGSVVGGWDTGGLVGMNWGTLSNCYYDGSVTTNASTDTEERAMSVGGLVGSNRRSTITNSISNCYSTGSVTGINLVNAGGLIGYDNAGTISNSFWDIETSGQSTSAGGTGKTTAEMKNIATFVDAGWNIIAVALNETNPAYIWNIVDNVTYPFLSWQP
jgi:hypothetical protein